MLLVAAVIGMLAGCSRGQNTGSQTSEGWPNQGDVCIPPDVCRGHAFEGARNRNTSHLRRIKASSEMKGVDTHGETERA